MVKLVNEILEAKKRAAMEALRYVNEAEIIGIGTGSTVNELIKLIGKKKREFKNKIFITSSYDSTLKLAEMRLKVLHPSTVSEIDIYIDGADEVDREMNMIKGGGAALTLEKLLAYYSKKRIFIVDYTKLVSWLGEKHPIPIDVIPYAVLMVKRKLEKMGFEVEVRRAIKGKYGPVTSDIGGVILDVKVEKPMNPRKLDEEIRGLPGVIETGLFIDLADKIIVGHPDKIELMEKEELKH